MDESMATIHTIGHSTRTLDELVAALKAHSIRTLVDIRVVSHVAPPAALQSRIA